MKKLILIVALTSVSVAGGAALMEFRPLGDEQIASATGSLATLKVLNVGCITCGPLVKRGLLGVLGVKEVSVQNFFGPSVTVRVVYDPKKITPAQLAVRTTNAGYPAQVISN